MLDSAEDDSSVAEPSASPGPGTPPRKQRRRKEHVDYEVVYEAVRDRPLTVESLVFHGLGRTRPELVVREFRRLHRAETLDDVRHELLEAHDALKALGPYDRVEVVLDDSATASSPILLFWFLEDCCCVTSSLECLSLSRLCCVSLGRLALLECGCFSLTALPSPALPTLCQLGTHG